VLTTPADLVESTDPDGKASDGGKTHTITLGTSGSFRPAKTVRIRAYSSWARNAPAQHLLSIPLSDPFFLFFRALSLIGSFLGVLFTDEIKGWLKRLLHKGQASKRTESPPTPAGR
jgi:hypothetical protein